MSLILDRVVNVHRLTADNDNTDKEQYASYSPLQNIAINVQPASSEDQILSQGEYGSTYVAFTTASGILEGDKLVDTILGTTWIVKGRQHWSTPGMSPHMELTLWESETGE